MTLQVHCDDCGYEFGVPADSNGKKVRCPSCHQANRISVSQAGVASLAILAGTATESKPIQALARENLEKAPEGDVPVLIFGVLGLVFCQFLGIFGLSTWNSYSKKCAEVGAEPSTLAQVGRILSICSLVILAFSILAIIVVIPLSMMG
ncbi:MAG: hypothetical protein V3W41_08135 [Planctomycetota bacterium]